MARDASWDSAFGAVLFRRAHEPPRLKVAGFDLDMTLLRWNCGGKPYPSVLDDYELWSERVPERMRALHADGYKIVIFANRAGVQGAFTGKNAIKVKKLVEWIAHVTRVPLHAVFATRKPPHAGEQYHKPQPGLWGAMELTTNENVAVDPASSFYVGTNAGREGDAGNSDKAWAEAVGAARSVALKLQTPEEVFGPPAVAAGGFGGDGGGGGDDPLAHATLLARSALLGGYLHGPRLVLLCGPQGAGKSHFCEALLTSHAPPSAASAPPSAGRSVPVASTIAGEGVVYTISDSDDDEEEAAATLSPPPTCGGGRSSLCEAVTEWVCTCQDTVGKGGRPGKREQCEAAAREALAAGKSVVVDRMHLTAEQRASFVALGAECGVAVDAVLLLPEIGEMQRRVRERSDHPGGVQGNGSVALVAQSYARFVHPSHAEGFELVSRLSTPMDVTRLTGLYRRLLRPSAAAGDSPPAWPAAFELSSRARPLPSVALGTMRLRGDALRQMLADGGFTAVDTAPTYENESAVGAAMDDEMHLTVKIPHGAVGGSAVRGALTESLRKLNRARCQLLLLHWPVNSIEAGSLREVWGAMESALEAGEAEALGVCNFSVSALRHLLSMRPKVLPCVNQVERHPLLPQWELLEFCAAHRIVLQAHSPLAHAAEWLLSHAVVRRIATESGLTSAQLCVQWNLCHGVAVVPKCSSREHAREILVAAGADGGACPVLTASQMKWLDSITPPGSAGRRAIAPPFMFKKGASAHLYAWGR